MNHSSNKDPLHGVTLENILIKLEAELGWDKMSSVVNINCFSKDPSIKSSLKFLRRTPWARAKVESLYIETFHSDYTPSKTTFSWPKC